MEVEGDAAWHGYLSLPSLVQPHLLDGDELVVFHHRMRSSMRARHLLSAAWCAVDLAFVRDAEGQRAEANELLRLASHEADFCARLVAEHYRHSEEYYDRYYRTELLRHYMGHFATIGLTEWPDEQTKFQHSSYGAVQQSVVNPLLKDFRKFRNAQTETELSHRSNLKGLLGEVVALQSLNRLQQGQKFAEWAVVPASARENSRGFWKQDHQRRRGRQSFDLKVVFADQTFIPAEIKWSRKHDDKFYDPRIAVVCINETQHAESAAYAMQKELAGRILSPTERGYINTVTELVLAGLHQVERQGVSLYGDGLESYAAELSLANLLTADVDRLLE